MFRTLYSQTLILQILLITIVACQSIPNSSGDTLNDFNLEAGTPMSIRCSISNQQQYANSTYNLSSEDLFIKFHGNFLGNFTVIGNRASMYSKQNAVDDFYSKESKFKPGRASRVSRQTPERKLTTYFTDVKPSSMILHWSIPSESKYHCEPHLSLKYNIRYHPVNETKFKEAWPGSPTDSIQLLNLIPNTRYEFIFRCRPSSEKNDSVWSFSKGFYKTTPPDVPYWRPETTNSSFSSEIENFEDAEKSLNLFRYVHRRTITIYWKNIPVEFENGEKLQYWIRVSSPFRPYLTKEVSASRETSYSFTGMLPGVSYRFEIFAGNVVGNSSNSSEIIVREESSLLDGLERIVFLSRRHDYEMFFFPGRDKVKYYTLFWCKSAQPRPVRCEDSLRWLNLPWDGISYHLRLSQKSIDYQFAVSANSETDTSGMIWAHCHISENEEHVFDKLWDVCLSFISLLKAGPSGIWRRTDGILYL